LAAEADAANGDGVEKLIVLSHWLFGLLGRACITACWAGSGQLDVRRVERSQAALRLV
jgi:hypothetical protein